MGDPKPLARFLALISSMVDDASQMSISCDNPYLLTSVFASNRELAATMSTMELLA